MVANSDGYREPWSPIDEEMAELSSIPKMGEIIPELMGSDDGLPFKMDRLKCLGNAIVPQIAQLIFAQPAFDEWRHA